MKTKKLYFVFLLLISLNGFSQINVPADYPSIQQAINNANPDDVIIVANGTYTENLVIDKPLTITSEYINTNNPLDISNTILDGNNSGSTIKATNISGNVIIKGLTIQNGNGSDFELYPNVTINAGGGIYATNIQNLNIERCIVRNNAITTTNNIAGGLLVKDSNIIILASTFVNNASKGENFDGDGSAIYSINSQIDITNSLINNNISGGYDFRSAISVRGGELNIQNTTVRDNIGGYYTGLVSKEADVTIQNSTFTGNRNPIVVSGTANFTGSSLNNITHNLTIADSQINNNDYGGKGTIRLIETNALFNDVEINNNQNSYGQKSGAVNINYSIVAINNSEIKGNTASYLTPTNIWYQGEGAGVRAIASEITINNSDISNNSCNSEDLFDAGGAFYLSQTVLTLNNCMVANNTANEGGAIASAGGNTIKTYKTVFYGNNATKGAVLRSVSSEFQFINTTMTKNFNADNNATSIYTDGNDDILFLNSILWNEGISEITKQTDTNSSLASSLTFSHSNIRGMDSFFIENGTLNKDWQVGNFHTDSIFIDENNNNFNLQDASPLINQGIANFQYNGVSILNLTATDYEGTAPEIGAFEKTESLFVSENNVESNLVIYTNDETITLYTKDNTSIKQVSVYNTLGKKIATFNPNFNRYNWKMNLNDGTILFFTVQLENGKVIRKKFMVKKSL